MMLHIDTHIDTDASRVRIAHTETSTDSEVIARAALDNGIGFYFGANVKREDLSDSEISTVTFWRD